MSLKKIIEILINLKINKYLFSNISNISFTTHTVYEKINFTYLSNSLYTKVGHRVKYNEKYNVYIWLGNYNDASFAA